MELSERKSVAKSEVRSFQGNKHGYTIKNKGLNTNKYILEAKVDEK